MSRRSLVEYTKALIRAGVMERPAWMTALERTPPLPVGKPGKRPPRIVYPEDELVDTYYRKHPEARLEAIDLASFEPPTARRFALRQLELMNTKKWTQRRAYAAAEVEFAAQRAQAEAAAGGVRHSIIDQIQTEEEQHLQTALRQYAQSYGPVQVKQHARELWQGQQTGAARMAAARAQQQRVQQQQRTAAHRASMAQKQAAAVAKKPQPQGQQQAAPAAS